VIIKHLYDFKWVNDLYLDLVEIANDKNASLNTRVQAAGAIMHINKKDVAISLLLSIATEPSKDFMDIFEQKSAITALQGYGADDKLMEVLGNKFLHHEIRMEACTILCKGKYVESTVHYLETSSRDRIIDARVRLEMTQLLGKLKASKYIPEILLEIAQDNKAGSWTQSDALEQLTKLNNLSYMRRIAWNQAVDKAVKVKALIYLLETKDKWYSKIMLVRLGGNQKVDTTIRQSIAAAFWQLHEYNNARTIIRHILRDSSIEASNRIDIVEDAIKMGEKDTVLSILKNISANNQEEVGDRVSAIEKLLELGEGKFTAKILPTIITTQVIDSWQTHLLETIGKCLHHMKQRAMLVEIIRNQLLPYPIRFQALKIGLVFIPRNEGLKMAISASCASSNTSPWPDYFWHNTRAAIQRARFARRSGYWRAS